MILKYFFYSIVLFSSLEAEIAQEKLNDIYVEAVFFVIVIVTMSIISYIYSTKHAKEYAIKNQKNIDAKREAKKDEIKSKEDRVKELQDMLDKNMITQDEFKMMKKRMYNTDEE